MRIITRLRTIKEQQRLEKNKKPLSKHSLGEAIDIIFGGKVKRYEK